MWIEELKNGKFKCVERYHDPMSGKTKKISITIDKNTKKAVKDAEMTLNSKLNELLNISPSSDEMRLNSLVRLYMEEQEKVNKKSTVSRNKFAFKKLMALLGEDTLVDRLNAGYVRKCLMKDFTTPSDFNENIRRFKQLIRWGFDNDYVKDINYLAKLKKMKDEEKKSKIEEKYLEPEQIKILLNGMIKDHWKTLTNFLLLSGLRIGEALALEYTDIDLVNREIYVTKTYDVNNDVTTSTKTSAGNRIVYIQDELFPLAKRIRSDAMTERFLSNSNLAFQMNGERYKYGSYAHYISENGLNLLGKKHVTAHMMRHTHISLLAAEGLTFDEIARRVGHEDSKVTREIYFHVTEKLKQKERERIKEIKIL